MVYIIALSILTICILAQVLIVKRFGITGLFNNPISISIFFFELIHLFMPVLQWYAGYFRYVPSYDEFYYSLSLVYCGFLFVVYIFIFFYKFDYFVDSRESENLYLTPTNSKKFLVFSWIVLIVGIYFSFKNILNINAIGVDSYLKDRIGFSQDPNDNTVTSLFNIGKFKTAGVSLTNTFAYKALKADLGLSYIGRYNSFSEGDFSIAVPQFSWTPEIFSNLIYNLPKIDASVSAFIKYTGQRPGYKSDNTVPNAVKETRIGAFSWTDIMFNKNIYKHFTINAGVKNLFDVTQLSNTETGSSGPHGDGGGSVAYSYGRSFVLGLTFNWNKS